MGPDRISAAHLSVRVSELYASNKLVFDARKSDELSEIYVKASEHVVSELGVNEQKEWSDYGSGFASFYDSWFYKNEDQFIVRSDGIEGSCYRGVFVLFSLLEPMFTVGEGIKNWSENGSGSYLPDIEMVDAYESKHVRELSQRICRVLRDFGIPQASKRTLDERIDTSIQIDTNMNDGPLKLFDAFYHWMD